MRLSWFLTEDASSGDDMSDDAQFEAEICGEE